MSSNRRRSRSWPHSRTRKTRAGDLRQGAVNQRQRTLDEAAAIYQDNLHRDDTAQVSRSSVERVPRTADEFFQDVHYVQDADGNIIMIKIRKKP